LALWEIACHAPGTKIDSHRARYFPLGLPILSAGGHVGPSREFSFALHQIQQAIEPHLSLQQTLYSWNQIAQALAEKYRNRLPQLAKWRAS
jgi:hypothetical protein